MTGTPASRKAGSPDIAASADWPFTAGLAINQAPLPGWLVGADVDALATGQTDQGDDINEYTADAEIVPEQLTLTKTEEYCSFVALILGLIGWAACVPIWGVSWLLKCLGGCLAKGLGARLLHTEQYQQLKCSFFSFGWVFFPKGVFEGMRFLLTEPVRKCWVDALNVIIIVSGLLTTSSYSAMYSGFGNAPASDGGKQAHSVESVQSWFRAANTVSFLASLVTIVISALLILALQKFATITVGESPVLTTWSQALLYFGFRLSVFAFFTSLAAAFVAVAFAAHGMFVNVPSDWADSVVIWCFLVVSLVLIFAGALVMTIEIDDDPNAPNPAALLSAAAVQPALSPATPAAAGDSSGRSARSSPQRRAAAHPAVGTRPRTLPPPPAAAAAAAAGAAGGAAATVAPAPAARPPRGASHLGGSAQRAVRFAGKSESMPDLHGRAQAEPALAAPLTPAADDAVDLGCYAFSRRSSLMASERADSGDTTTTTSSQQPLLQSTAVNSGCAGGQQTLSRSHGMQESAGSLHVFGGSSAPGGYGSASPTSAGRLSGTQRVSPTQRHQPSLEQVLAAMLTEAESPRSPASWDTLAGTAGRNQPCDIETGRLQLSQPSIAARVQSPACLAGTTPAPAKAHVSAFAQHAATEAHPQFMLGTMGGPLEALSEQSIEASTPSGTHEAHQATGAASTLAAGTADVEPICASHVPDCGRNSNACSHQGMQAPCGAGSAMMMYLLIALTAVTYLAWSMSPLTVAQAVEAGSRRQPVTGQDMHQRLMFAAVVFGVVTVWLTCNERTTQQLTCNLKLIDDCCPRVGGLVLHAACMQSAIYALEYGVRALSPVVAVTLFLIAMAYPAGVEYTITAACIGGVLCLATLIAVSADICRFLKESAGPFKT